jgi:hypothetical protein
VENLVGANNVFIANRALSEFNGACEIKNDEPGNLGAQYAMPVAAVDNRGFELVYPPGAIRSMPIDGLSLKSCDLIYLDIEGGEMPALRGARKTIEKFKPVIVVEDKKLSHRYGYSKGQIETWLAADYGYKVVARPHRDVVMACV